MLPHKDYVSSADYLPTTYTVHLAIAQGADNPEIRKVLHFLLLITIIIIVKGLM
jgi:hypothetical protein